MTEKNANTHTHTETDIHFRIYIRRDCISIVRPPPEKKNKNTWNQKIKQITEIKEKHFSKMQTNEQQLFLRYFYYLEYM